MEGAEYVVVGGGVTGLWAAESIARHGGEVTIISDNWGGLLDNYEMDGFTFDFGGHVYTTRDTIVKHLLESAGAELHEREAFYLNNHRKLVQYPVQDHPSAMELQIKGKTPKYEKQSLAEFAVEAFGEEFYFGFFKPFNERVWTIDPLDMDSDWVDGRVKTPSEERRGWGPNATFYYAPGHKIIERLMDKAIEVGVDRRTAYVSEVNTEKKQLLLTTTYDSPRWFKYDKLIWTLPISRLSDKVGISPTIFKRNTVRTIGVGLKADAFPELPAFHWMYCNISSRVHRVTRLDRYHPDMAPDNCWSLLLEIPWRMPSHTMPLYSTSPLQGSWTAHIGLHRDKAVRALKDAGFNKLKQADIVTAAVADCAGYPIPTRGIRETVATAKLMLSRHDIYTAGRWGSHAYFNIDHCNLDAMAASFAARGHLKEVPNEYLYASFYYRPYQDVKIKVD